MLPVPPLSFRGNIYSFQSNISIYLVTNRQHHFKTSQTTMSSTTHLAAILESKGSPFIITQRPTPKPGPNKLLIEVKSIALNPIDSYVRDFGFMIKSRPAVPCSDIAGTVIASGSSVPSSAPKTGNRVLAFAPCFFTGGVANYGAFQEKDLVPWQNACPLPDETTFNQGAMLSMAVVITWAGLHYAVDLPTDSKFSEADKKGFLIWGGASSVGSAVI
jgi:NADPH:quinone reductase-like Zn-dependent oxidoreductase